MDHLKISEEVSTSWNDFLISLLETQIWVSNMYVVSMRAYNLRTIELAPNPLENGRRAVVQSVQYERHYALKRRNLENARSLNGRLLAYEPDGTLRDGAAAVETRGYFADDNSPAWDTWVGWFEDSIGRSYGYLVCWVPDALVDAVDRGIEANPEQCIWWIDNTDNALAYKLRQCDML